VLARKLKQQGFFWFLSELASHNDAHTVLVALLARRFIFVALVNVGVGLHPHFVRVERVVGHRSLDVELYWWGGVVGRGMGRGRG